MVATGSRPASRVSPADDGVPEAGHPADPGLQDVVRLTAVIALGVGGLFFLISLLVGNPLEDGFIFAIGVTVALVPEALLPTVTLSLAWGAEQMAKRQILVRNLEAVETLGSTTFICTDKTGTLTQNQMEVVEAWTSAGELSLTGEGHEPEAELVWSARAGAPLVQLALAAVRCSTGYTVLVDGRWRPHGDPMEAALDTFARRLGIDTDADRLQHPNQLRFPFDPRTRRMSVVVDRAVVVKGAPDAVLPPVRQRRGARAAVEALTARGFGPGHRGGRPGGRPSSLAAGGRVRPPPDRPRGARGPTAGGRRRGARGLPEGGHQRGHGDGRPPGDGGRHRRPGGSEAARRPGADRGGPAGARPHPGRPPGPRRPRGRRVSPEDKLRIAGPCGRGDTSSR